MVAQRAVLLRKLSHDWNDFNLLHMSGDHLSRKHIEVLYGHELLKSLHLPDLNPDRFFLIFVDLYEYVLIEALSQLQLLEADFKICA